MEERPSRPNDGKSVDKTENTTSIAPFCSFAVTGSTNAVFQAIFVCRSCCRDDELLCVCQACADNCHKDHEGLEYVGMGPSYCDCHQLGCRIQERSVAEAKRLEIQSGSCCCSPNIQSVTKDIKKEGIESFSYIRDVFQIPAVERDEGLRNCLIQQAQELVKHSKDTFWLDAARFDEDNKDASLCDLEKFARRIFQQHVKEYGLLELVSDRNDGQTGAEWWVQVKTVSLPPPIEKHLVREEECRSAPKRYSYGQEAVDLHYDKDEELAQSFGIGSFPTLSTVTYLTSFEQAPPTLVFSRRYEEDEDAPISEMLVSHPSNCGKHLVFDGRLLHGAPSHYGLRKMPPEKQLHCDSSNLIRITFLVNIWLNHKPVGIEILPTEIRNAIERASPSLGTTISSDTIEFIKESSILRLCLTNVAELPEASREKIELPFVGGKATWGDGSSCDQEDVDDTTTVLTYLPPPRDNGTFLVRFGSDLRACLASSGGI